MGAEWVEAVLVREVFMLVGLRRFQLERRRTGT